METKICTKCGENLPLDQFNYRDKVKGARRSECKKCHTDYMKKAYSKKKEAIQELKSQISCQKCGETRGYCLDYHHVDPNTKVNTVARLTSNAYSMETIYKEIEKCIVLCANCHREYHHLQEKDKNLTIQQYLS